MKNEKTYTSVINGRKISRGIYLLEKSCEYELKTAIRHIQDHGWKTFRFVSRRKLILHGDGIKRQFNSLTRMMSYASRHPQFVQTS